MRQLVDRGFPLDGIQKTARDHKLSPAVARAIENFRMPDKRLRRRRGFGEYSNGFTAHREVLTKHTGAWSTSRANKPGAVEIWQRQYTWQTPLSYGLIKWHDDFQFKAGRDMNIGFWFRVGEEEPLVSLDAKPDAIWGANINGFGRIAPSRPTPTSYHFLPREVKGVFLYDQSVIANDCKFHNGSTTITLPTNVSQSSGDWSSFDAVVLPTMAITYSKNSSGNIRFEFEWAVLDKNTDTYYRVWDYYDTSDTYTPGDEHHICLTYRSSDNYIRLIVDGTYRKVLSQASAGLANWAWAGELDAVNGWTSGDGRYIKRDIVLLNECTVRGNYSSTCSTRSRGHLDVTAAGSWTNHAANIWKTTCYSLPESVYYYDSAGVILNYGTKKAGTGSLSANYDWYWDGSNTLYIYYNGGNPGTASITTEIIFTPIGALNNIPHMTQANISSVSINQPNPWACSPPRGTAMFDLWIWHEYIFGETVAPIIGKELQTPYDADMVGYWKLADGASILKEEINGRDGSIHHGYPAWVNDTSLLTGLGLKFADGQHLLLTTEAEDIYYKKDIQPYLVGCFGQWNFEDYNANVTENNKRTGDFTVQMGLRTPYTFQDRKDEHAEDRYNGGFVKRGGDTIRESLGAEPILNGTTVVPVNVQSYLQTLFSVEGTKKLATADEQSTDSDNTRIPVTQGFLDESGYIRFHVYGRWDDGGVNGYGALYDCIAGNVVATGTNGTAGSGNQIVDGTNPFGSVVAGQKVQVVDSSGMYYFVATVTVAAAGSLTLDKTWTRTGSEQVTVFSPLSVDTYYDLTFRLRTDDRNSSGDETWMDVWINDNKVSQIGLQKAGYVLHQPNYSISVGASYVDDYVDESISAYELIQEGTTLPNAVPASLKHGTQHFMTHRQDMPGFFTLGHFRLWASVALDDEEVKKTRGTRLTDRYFSHRLLINLEPDTITGDEIPSKSTQPLTMKLGFKSHGVGIDNFFFDGALPYEPHIVLGWNGEDCLGWTAKYEDISLASYVSSDALKECNGLAFYSSTLRQVAGLLFVFGNSLLVDKNLNESVTDGYLTAQGLLNDFSRESEWQSTNIGDKALLYSRGGLPKVYNGTFFTKAGLRRWTGGRIRATVVVGTANKLSTDTWYHVRLAYFDSEDSLLSVSPPIVLKTTSSKREIRIHCYPEHPDPRVTSMRLYATPGETADLALNSPPRLSYIGSFENNAIAGDPQFNFIGYGHDDALLFPVVLDLDVVPPPICGVVASYNGRCVVGDNNLVPDAVFWSDAGNPEKFRLDNRAVLEESTGDRVVALIPAFGSLFIFKNNSIWKMDEVQPGVMQFNRIVSNIGAVSAKAVLPITIPETGQSAIFFWSKHGPYLFDGSRTIYLGLPIEESFDDRSFSWLDDSSVLVTHEIKDREILVFYREANSSREVTEKALVLHYRWSNLAEGMPLWTTYTGMVGKNAFTLTKTLDSSSSGVPGPATLSPSSKDLTVIGGHNGQVYLWGTSDYDGGPSSTMYARQTILTYSGGNIGVTTAPFNVRGSWVTLVKADYSAYETALITEQNYSSNTFKADFSTLTPEVGDYIYINRAPAYVEFPWDSLDIPFAMKEVKEMWIWGDGGMHFRFSADYESSPIDDYEETVDVDFKRRRLHFVRSLNVEVLKLEIVNFEIDSRIDSYLYWMVPASDAVVEP